MYNKIGDINGNFVELNSSFSDMGVQELPHDEIIAIIANSDAYLHARDEHVINNTLKIITWQQLLNYRGLVYYINLVRTFSIGYIPHTTRLMINSNTSDKKSINPEISIKELCTNTYFEITFNIRSQKSINFYNTYITEITKVSVPTIGNNKDVLELNFNKFIDGLYQTGMPAFISNLNKRIDELNKLKAECLSIFP